MKFNSLAPGNCDSNSKSALSGHVLQIKFVSLYCGITHDDVTKWKHFPRYWPFVRGFPAQRPVTRSFDIFFDLCLNKQLSKQSWGWWFETQSRPLWRHSSVSCECQWKPLVLSCHWFRERIGTVGQQVFAWANVDPDVCRHMASLDHR